MKSRTCLSVAAGLAVALTVACSRGVAPPTPPTYTLNCEDPDQNDAAAVRTIANGLTYGNPGHGQQGPGPIPATRAPFRAVLVADSSTETVVGPRSVIVAEEFAVHLSAAQLAGGQIIGQVWVDTAFTSGRDAAGNTIAGALQLPPGTSYVAACVPQNSTSGTPIKGLLIPETTGDIKGITGTYYDTRRDLKNATAVWQSSSKSTLCIACGRGWCQY